MLLRGMILQIFIMMSLSMRLTTASTYTSYVMGYFKESPDGSDNSFNLHLAVSIDGLKWIPLNQNNYVMRPAMGTGYLRDPFFYRMPNGTFTIVATDNWKSEYIHIWSSPDLRTFSNERLFRVNTTGMHSWAPEIFYDESGSQYAIIWSGNTDRNRIYVNYTKDFTSVTTPKIFFDPGFSVIDGHMEVGIDGYNYLYYKSEVDFKLYGARSTTLDLRSFDSSTYTTGYGAPFDLSQTVGPILIRNIVSPKIWWLWGDSPKPINAVFYAWQTSDLSNNSWTVLNNRDYTPPLNVKHATIVPITTEEYNNLVSKWGIPSWDILKTYKYPNCYIRHENLVGKISAIPFDPTADMKWRLVSGLADPDGISFKAVNMPNYYLRHRNFSLILSENDSSTSFKSDATFYKRNGFADSSWTSFQSYNYPEKYIRLSEDSTLSIDTITDSSLSTDKEDATFEIVYSSVIESATGVKQSKLIESNVRHKSRAVMICGTTKSISLDFQKPLMQEDVIIYLFDVSGRLASTLYTGRLLSNHIVLPLNRKKNIPGTYIVKIISNNKSIISEQVILNQ